MTGFRLRDARGRAALQCAVVVSLLAVAARAAAVPHAGRVVDAASGAPIAGATVTVGRSTTTSDERGRFAIDAEGEALRLRAPGYRRADVAIAAAAGGVEVALAPFRPKALYLSYHGIGHGRLRQNALDLIEATELDALVIDVKGDAGRIAYASEVPLAAATGAADRRTIADPEALLRDLHARGIYVIARIVVFKDDPLATARPDLAVRGPGGGVWRDREHLSWTDPFREEVRAYNVALALEAARHGFDEIQLDYVRFPDARGLAFAEPSTQASRIAAIGALLSETRRALVPYNVFLSADVFGYVCWNLDDTDIGQKLEDLVPLVDYVSPMLYPSSFQFGIPGYRFAVAYPYEIVYCSLERARRRTGLPPHRFRPWLQAFKDYGFDRRPFTGSEIRAQITAAEDFGADGWMLWNPRNVYTADGLRSEAPEP